MEKYWSKKKTQDVHPLTMAAHCFLSVKVSRKASSVLFKKTLLCQQQKWNKSESLCQPYSIEQLHIKKLYRPLPNIWSEHCYIVIHCCQKSVSFKNTKECCPSVEIKEADHSMVPKIVVLFLFPCVFIELWGLFLQNVEVICRVHIASLSQSDQRCESPAKR